MISTHPYGSLTMKLFAWKLTIGVLFLFGAASFATCEIIKESSSSASPISHIYPSVSDFPRSSLSAAAMRFSYFTTAALSFTSISFLYCISKVFPLAKNSCCFLVISFIFIFLHLPLLLFLFILY